MKQIILIGILVLMVGCSNTLTSYPSSVEADYTGINFTLYLHEAMIHETGELVPTDYDIFINGNYIGQAKGSVLNKTNISLNGGDDVHLLITVPEADSYIYPSVYMLKVDRPVIQVTPEVRYADRMEFRLEDEDYNDVFRDLEGKLRGDYLEEEYILNLHTYGDIKYFLACDYSPEYIRDVVMHRVPKEPSRYDVAFNLEESQNTFIIATRYENGEFNTTINCELMDGTYARGSGGPEFRYKTKLDEDVGQPNLFFNITIEQRER